LGLLSGRSPDAYFVTRGLGYFALIVQDDLFKAFQQALQLSATIQSVEVRNYIRFGAGRRLNALWHAHRSLIGIAPVDRKTPLSTDEGRSVTRYLNVIYINVTGVLDNLCVALLHEYAPDAMAKLRPYQIGLFQKVLEGYDQFDLLVASLAEHEEWNADLKNRRNPSAHRIPLYVPPQVVTPEQAEKINGLWDEHSERMQKLDIDDAGAALQKMESIGIFVPYFAHEPDAGAFPLYPTVSDDLGHALEVFELVRAFMAENSVRVKHA